METEAKLEIQRRIQAGTLDLVWSYMLDYENRANPFEERRAAIAGWRRAASIDVDGDPSILERAHGMLDRGLRPKDAIHLACAVSVGCDFFLTTDDLLIKRMRAASEIRVINPAQFVTEVE